MAKKTYQSNVRRRKNTSIVTNEMAKSPVFWILIIVGFCVYFFFFRDDKEGKPCVSIDKTSTCITAITETQQWEFLTIQMEEMVDTVIQKTLTTNTCNKIYKGIARLGIDTKKANKSWIMNDGEDITVSLPPIELLDKEIIDDTQTRTFIEDGNISATVKEKMYRKAKKQMKERAMQKENIKTAEENAKATFSNIFNALGYKKVKINIKQEK